MTFYGFTCERSTEELVDAYVLSRSKAKSLSIPLAIRAIRTLSPEYYASDRELAGMIEATAVEHGVAVSVVRKGQEDSRQLAS